MNILRNTWLEGLWAKSFPFKFNVWVFKWKITP